MRSHASTSALSCPGGWLHDVQQREATMRASHKDRMRETSAMWDSMGRGEMGKTAMRRTAPTAPVISVPGGGRTQGARPDLRPSQSDSYVASGDRPASSARYQGAPGFRYCADTKAYNNARHGWHDPRGLAEQERLKDPTSEGSWPWMMRKARDHVGYGDDGIVSSWDVQKAAVSGDSPAWFIGNRTIPGPRNTKSVPVRRCPVTSIEDNKMTVRAKTYELGGMLETIETVHPGATPVPPRTAAREPTLKDRMHRENPARMSNLYGGACVLARPNPPR